MKKTWSITTTVRNPYRLRDILRLVTEIENDVWDLESQKKIQILLIKNRLYGYDSKQFYAGLTEEQKEIINNTSKNITFEKAEEIFNAKKYTDPSMRGRQSLNPLKKFGFIFIQNKKIKITNLGKSFLKKDYNLQDIFLNSLLKFQIPNPILTGYEDINIYNIKPFIATLHVIKKVNEKEKERGNKEKGISKYEFELFILTLVF